MLELRKDTSVKVLLIWTKQRSALYSTLSFNVTREVCEYLGVLDSLADPSSDFLRFFRHKPQLWTSPRPHPTLQICQSSSRWLILTDSSVFCCGGVETFSSTILFWSSTYLLGSNGNVKSLPLMISPRAFHGVIEWRNKVLVFGGRGQKRKVLSPIKEQPDYMLLTESEVCQLGGVVGWQARKPAQYGRCSFNPCLLGEVVYLCGYGTTAMEIFTPWLTLWQF